MWRGETKHTPLGSRRLAEVHLSFSQVSLAQFLLNIRLIFSCQNVAESHETSTGPNMSNRDDLKEERVFIKDPVEEAAEIRLGTKRQPSVDHTSPSQANASPSVAAQSENTRIHVAARTATMETAVDKHRGLSQRQCHDSSGLAEISSGYFVNRANVPEDGMSHTSSADLLATPASSRESILSELSYVTSPVSFRRMVSPCSSVCSGIFSPSVLQVKRHFLAPGSSLVNSPGFSSCESLPSSVSAQSPPPRPPRHRPPLTRLSLLTAILRKGRLPVLSSAFQRPYTPCWPVNPVTLSFCNACTAASSVSSIPLAFSSRFSSSASLDSQSPISHREPSRCATALPHVQSNELSRTSPQKRGSEQICSSSVPRSEQVIPLPRAPPLFGSNFNSVLPAKHGEMDYTISKKLPQTHKSPELKPVNADLHREGRADNNLKNLISEATKATYEQGTSALHPPNSSRTSPHSLSQQLRSPPVRPLLPQPSQPHSSGVTVFRDVASSPALNTTGRCESGRSCPDSKSTSALAGLHKAHCLSPSRYTPMAFPRWPSPTSSPAPTPSPPPPISDLAPSPSLSVRSGSSPRPGSGISDWSDREGKKRKIHRIKLSYKSLAAIPTNTLLLDQQAIDEHVERGQSPCDSLHRCDPFERGVLDTHAKMFSPAERRQQSEELYAVIDDIMANSIAPSKSPQSSRLLNTSVGLQQKNSSLTKTLGRETKYASVGSLQPTTGVERKLMNPKKTKPGVIWPMTAVPKVTAEGKKEFNSDAFPPFVVKQASTDSKKVEGNRLHAAREDRCTSSKRQTFGEERKPERRDPLSVFDLQITEPDYQSAL